MDAKSIERTVLSVLKEVQRISGEDYVDISSGDKPLGTLGGFDSLKGLEATTMVEERLDCEIERTSLFVSEDGRRATTLAEICGYLVEITASDGREVA